MQPRGARFALLTQQLAEELEKEQNELQREWDLLAQEKQAWAATAKKLEALSGKRIKLDVGGQIFATTQENVLRHPNSFFGGMFSGRWDLAPEEDGSFFIDRDPIVFRHVLNFLRGLPIELETMSNPEKRLLLADAEYYHLPGLIELVIASDSSLGSPYEIHVEYQTDDNGVGIVHYLGTNRKTSEFQNPVDNGSIALTSSHEFKWGSLKQLTSRTKFNNSCGIESRDPNTWVCLDLKRKVKPTWYSLYHGNTSGYSIGSWAFEGSVSGSSWVVISSHEEPGWHKKRYNFCKSWQIKELPEPCYFRFFRIRMTGESPGYTGFYCLMLSGIEIYGYMLLDNQM